MNENGHLKFSTNKRTIHAVVCSVFDERKDALPEYDCVVHHARNLNEFINLECNGNQEVAARFMIIL